MAIEMDATTIIVRRVARELRPNTLVNLGIGMPTKVAGHLPPGVNVFLQSENGLLGMGPVPPDGMEDPDLTDAGGSFVTALPGAAAFDSAMSFGLIRGGHLDVTVLGGLQVDERGCLQGNRVKPIKSFLRTAITLWVMSARRSVLLSESRLKNRST